jgi:glycosyltransferase involved in cell wall biosynthesis
MVPHPVAEYFVFNPNVIKKCRVVAIGRWDDEAQKRPEYLMKAIADAIERNSELVVDILGVITTKMRAWRDGFDVETQKRIHLLGYLPNADLPSIYQRSQVLLCSSSYESFHIGAAEALCCGCTVVAPKLETLPSFEWFCESEGALTLLDTPEALALALNDELKLWSESRRDPKSISGKWCNRLHGPELCKQIINMAKIAPTELRTRA